jgi:RNA polymerase sigma factor (sigma-70 family)
METKGVTAGVGEPRPGDEPATFEEDYLRLAPRLRKLAVRRFGIPSGDAEALVHDVFATYITHAASVKLPEAYLIGAICNASRHYLRRSGAADALFCNSAPCVAASDGDILDEVHRKMLLSALLRRIGSRCRDLLHRYYVLGESTQTIADGLDSTPGTILVFLHQCRKRARAAYGSLSERS